MWLEELDKIKSITATEDEEEKSRLLSVQLINNSTLFARGCSGIVMIRVTPNSLFHRT